jgi:hypothetical protein
VPADHAPSVRLAHQLVGNKRRNSKVWTASEVGISPHHRLRMGIIRG